MSSLQHFLCAAFLVALVSLTLAQSNKLAYTDLTANEPKVVQVSQNGTNFAYFRVIPTISDPSKKYFEIQFSSCVGRIQVFYSKCDFQSDPLCNDQSDKWFPNEQNNQGVLIHNGHMSQVQSIFSSNEICDGHCYQKTGNNSQVIYFYGVKFVSFNGEGAASMEALLKFYSDAPGMKYNWMNMDAMVMVEGMMFMWPKAWYCDRMNGTNCDSKVTSSNMQFTIYSMYKQDKSPLYSDPSVNMGTICGIKSARAVQYDDPTTDTMVHYMPMDKMGEAFITVVGIDNSDASLWPMIYMPFHYNMTDMPEPNRKTLQIVLVSSAATVAAIMIVSTIVAVAYFAFLKYKQSGVSEYREL